MRKHCYNPHCKAPLHVSNISKENPTFCRDCGELVYAFQPDGNVPWEWFLVSDGSKPVEGSVVGGGQCAACGLSDYTIGQVNKVTWSADCLGQGWDDELLVGCYSRYEVRMKMRWEVM